MPNPHAQFHPNLRWASLSLLWAPMWYFAFHHPSPYAPASAMASSMVLLFVAGHLVMRPTHNAMRRLNKLRGVMCTACGFDLLGLAVTGNCPECGAAYHIEARAARESAPKM